jgi:hypothetical protein
MMSKLPARAWLVGFICLGFSSVIAFAQDVPRWKVDASWPKPLPNNWMAGHFEKVVVDKDDNIWVAHYASSMDRNVDHLPMGLAQTPPLAECCIPAPEVIQFDREGNVLRAWGGPGYIPQWPEALHAFWVDKNMNVWVGGNHAPDRNVLKFSADGKLLLEIGRQDGPVNRYRSNRGELATPDNQATDLLGGPSGIFVDEQANEVYITDGYINRRVVVYDSNTGKFKRGWGSHGIPLSEIDNNCTAGDCIAWRQRQAKAGRDIPPDKQFKGNIESVRISNDGLVYVVDRDARQIQVFTKEGKFLQEMKLARDTGTSFVPYSLTFSRDPEQKYLIVPDGHNGVVWVLNRKDGSPVTRLGSKGRNAGQFGELTSVDLDSRGNLYTTETKYHCRLQKFVPES